MLSRNLDLIKGAMEDLALSDDDRAKIMGKNAEHLSESSKEKIGFLQAGKVYDGRDSAEYKR